MNTGGRFVHESHKYVVHAYSGKGSGNSTLIPVSDGVVVACSENSNSQILSQIVDLIAGG